MTIPIFLSSIGLDAKTQKVYLAILRLQDAPAAAISRKAGLERTTTYHQLDKLTKMGLVSIYRSGGVKRFSAESVQKIKGILENKISLFDKYMPELKNISAGERVVNLRLFEGKEGAMQISEEELDCKEKLVRSIGSMRDLRKAGNGRITFTQRRVERKIFAKCLRPRDDEFIPGWIENQEKELRKVKLLPENILARGMTFIYDEKVAVITPEEEGLGFIITSKTFSDTMKNMFDALWETSANN